MTIAGRQGCDFGILNSHRSHGQFNMSMLATALEPFKCGSKVAIRLGLKFSQLPQAEPVLL